MTENKRFIDNGIEEIENQSFTDNLTEKTYWIDNGIDEIVALLNELNDKCEFLEIENESLEDGATKYAELYHKSLKENEQLKKSVKRQQGSNNECAKLIEEQQKENEQLKEENKKLKKENEQLKQRIKELEVENEAQSDAIDGLQEFMAHYDLEGLE